jgi:hypothetical protein
VQALIQKAELSAESTFEGEGIAMKHAFAMLVAAVLAGGPWMGFLTAQAQEFRPLIYGCQCGPETAEGPFIRISARPEIVALIKSWDKRIRLLTSQDAPLQTFQGLQKDEIAAWGAELGEQIKALSKLLGIKDESLRVIGTGNAIFTGMENPPKLFITWSGDASNVKGAVRIEVSPEAAHHR